MLKRSFLVVKWSTAAVVFDRESEGLRESIRVPSPDQNRDSLKLGLGMALPQYRETTLASQSKI
jgi:hypothetical protein